MTGMRGIWGIDPGADFARAFADGLLARHAGQPPDALARVRVIVPTRALQTRIAAELSRGAPRFLPRIEVLDDLADDPTLALPPADPGLVRTLTLARLVSRLVAAEPGLAAPSAVFDLAEALAALLDEMQAEAVAPDRLATLDVADHAAHWQASLRFLSLLGEVAGGALAGPEGRLRTAVTALASRWQAAPPRDPVILAGSTASRAPARLLALAVAALPVGSVVLPGFDFAMPAHAWASLSDPRTGEDHPQFRHARLLSDLGLAPGQVARWHGDAPRPARAALISLALRPAPVTDQWLTEGPGLGDPAAAVQDLTLIEAPDPRAEATAIACVLRDALEQGLSATLMTPDRLLARRVSAVLDGWHLRPDDSAGRPLALTAPGRLLRHAAGLLADRLTAEALVVVLKHPLVHSGTDRGPHLLFTRELELRLRRSGPPFPDRAALTDWAAGDRAPPGAAAWAEWLCSLLPPHDPADTPEPVATRVQRHLTLAEALAAGPGGQPAQLWAEAAGIAARDAMDALTAAAVQGAPLTARDYVRLLDRVLAGRNVADDTPSHPLLRFRGPREARSEAADVLILAGLNDGTWPAFAAPDPWMSRGMRHAAGLMLPERQIGLSAHDFQMAACAPRVVLSRARRDDAAETVPSRWLNRLTNLMSGLPAPWADALADLRARGDHWLTLGATLSRPATATPPEPRPAPAPPATARPRALSITQIQTLIRDPYAIYAREVLRLRPLDPLTRAPDPRDRGTVLHAVLESLVAEDPYDEAIFAATLLARAEAQLARDVPWPAARRLWLARLAVAAPDFAAAETVRRDRAQPFVREGIARLDLPGAGFCLTGKIDRIDRTPDGGWRIYDYKTGAPPKAAEQRHFDRQLALSALCVARGAVAGVAPGPVTAAAFLSLAPGAAEEAAPADDLNPDTVDAALRRLMEAWADPDRGYAARRAIRKTQGVDAGPYDHLARFGEWAQTDTPRVMAVGR
ncbi:MAG: double-strand break repair protein AddB [Rhodobacteraceae bacterium]|jgi:double-strand break repair protein AddB|nr:double-strand break repair protein AddB [Paracoccaceae bacterium]